MGNCLHALVQPNDAESIYKPKTWESADEQMQELLNTRGIYDFRRAEGLKGPVAFPFIIKGKMFCKVVLKTRSRNDFKIEFNIQQLQHKIGKEQNFFLLPSRIEKMSNSTIFCYDLLDCDMVDWIHHNDWTMTHRNNIFTKICAAIEFLHDRDIVHRDIKLENICMRNNEPVIIDLDFAGDANIYKFKGTRDYLPSKQLMKDMMLTRNDISVSDKSKWLDCYALAKTFALVLCVENSRLDRPHDKIKKIWSGWCKKSQGTLGSIVIYGEDLFIICKWWELIFAFAHFNDVAVYDRKKKLFNIKFYKKIIKDIYR